MTGPVPPDPAEPTFATVASVEGATAGTAHEHPYTLAIDVGGTGLKANVLGRGRDARRRPGEDPDDLPDAAGPHGREAHRSGPEAARGRPHLVRLPRHGAQRARAERAALRDQEGPGTEIVPELVKAWSDFDLASALAASIGKPCRVANDADVQGAAVVEGTGFEAVITLGTGVGTAFFMDGRMLPHLEFAHLEFRKGDTFNEQLGEPVRKKIGDKRWNKRVQKAIAYFDALTFFDHLFIGGGNAQRINRRDLGDVLERITVVDNSAGILGGIKLWEDQHIAV